MCGIVALLRKRVGAEVFSAIDVKGPIESALALLPSAREVLDGGESGVQKLAAASAGAVEHLERANRILKQRLGLRHLVLDASLRESIVASTAAAREVIAAAERLLDSDDVTLDGSALEAVSASLLALKDAVWALEKDRVGSANSILKLASGSTEPFVIDGLGAVQLVLSALDRLEVRGRDSAGIYLLVTGHGLDLESEEYRQLVGSRRDNRLFTNMAVREVEGQLGFVYKVAAEIGELGDNVAALSASVRGDALLRLALESPDSQVAVIGHTRWASVGMINEANAHPLIGEERSTGQASNQDASDQKASDPMGTLCSLASGIAAALNGDVDNHADLKAADELAIADEITTDAKVIPVLVSRRVAEKKSIEQAFIETVSRFVGSVAIATNAAHTPEKMMLALRGSGQALYVGLSDDAFIVASEPYGVVELTQSYLRLDGETPGNPESPEASRGQVVVLDRTRAGSIDGITRYAYDGTELPVGEDDLKRVELTTRDIDRGEYTHYLLKEISESPRSFRKTLRGKIRRDESGLLHSELSEASLPESIVRRFSAGEIRRIYVIGQGTAAVAGIGVARELETLLPRSIAVRALPATELSGFGLDQDMSDVLIIAISQSGTTTDTNRTVDLARGRGASVLAIVNRRHADLTDKSDGVLYTSDGRDVEMSVASTKAFYSQIAAGFLMATALCRIAPDTTEAVAKRRARECHDLLAALIEMPEIMERCLLISPRIEQIAARHAPYHRYWALVGNGSNLVAAEEIRIKLSELCYKSIACDATEDKKHIDLSSEPLIFVCAAGLRGSTADDVAKEVAIYRAHKAKPIVVATEGEQRFAAALELIPVPETHPDLAFVLSVMAGHLFGYHAALAIDRLAHPLRAARTEIESAVSEGQGDDLLTRLAPRLSPHLATFFKSLVDGAYNGHLEASTATQIASLFRYAAGSIQLSSYDLHHGGPGTPGAVVADLLEALSQGIDELTRPVDAIKHQAKTVTVGISRSDENLLTVPLVQAVLATGVSRDGISYSDLKSLAALDPVVNKVLGHTRYRLDGFAEDDDCQVHVVDMGGIARDLKSRTQRLPTLRGTKRRVAVEKELLAARGRSDGRNVLLIPEAERGHVVGLVLLHVQYLEHAPAGVLRGALGGYRSRYSALRDLVMETEPVFREDVLESIPVDSLLVDSILALSELWRERNP
jgi:glucosamine--fructose-6-phosphate aminotransferase (isomerizing)